MKLLRNITLIILSISALILTSCKEFCENGVSQSCENSCNNDLNLRSQQCYSLYHDVDEHQYNICMDDATDLWNDCIDLCPCEPDPYTEDSDDDYKNKCGK